MQNPEDGRSRAISEIVSNAFLEVKRKYGSGHQDGESPRAYHNSQHTKDVITMASLLAKTAYENGRIEFSEIGLVKIAAAYHDIEQDLGSGANEDLSAKLAAQAMHESGFFTPQEITLVNKMILSTAVYFENGYVAQHPGREYVCKIVADADLSSLGRDEAVYRFWANALFKEIKFPGLSEEDFLKKQKLLLQNHRYHTEEARELFDNLLSNLESVEHQYVA